MVSLLLLAVGLIIGTLNGWMVDRIGRWLYLRSQGYSQSVREWRARVAYFCLGLWILVALFLGGEIRSVVLRAIGREA
jgi:hypothetical protein